MAEEPKNSVNIDLGVSAKLDIKAEIPPDASGGLVKALTDIIRPFSEKQGLRADQIRLQREDVLIKITEKANKRLELEGSSPSEVSNKFLIPFLEKASYENIDDEFIIDHWASLLTNAAQDADKNYNWVIDILSSINSEQAKMIEKLTKTVDSKSYKFAHMNMPSEYSGLINSTFRAKNFTSENEALESIRSLEGITLLFPGDEIPNTEEFSFFDVPYFENLHTLSFLNLIFLFYDSFHCDYGDRQERVFFIHYNLTARGFLFSKIVSSDGWK